MAKSKVSVPEPTGIDAKQWMIETIGPFTRGVLAGMNQGRLDDVLSEVHLRPGSQTWEVWLVPWEAVVNLMVATASDPAYKFNVYVQTRDDIIRPYYADTDSARYRRQQSAGMGVLKNGNGQVLPWPSKKK